MPLAFDSLSHGTVAFGFFNIETDMLLLDRIFFFASDFCEAVTAAASPEPAAPACPIEGWRIDDRSALGDLHGAIAGQILTGFIGATYARFPFPAHPDDFKQNPDPRLERAEVEAMMAPFGTPTRIRVEPADAGRIFHVGDYRFDRPGFARLVAYVERGGYPRWLEERRPGYVTAMLDSLPDDLRDGNRQK